MGEGWDGRNWIPSLVCLSAWVALRDGMELYGGMEEKLMISFMDWEKGNAFTLNSVASWCC